MPTGYTIDVQSGKVTTLNDFAMRCARAFGATIMMRDGPADKPIPLRFEPQTDYYDRELAAAQNLVHELEEMPASEHGPRAEAEYQNSLASYEKRVAERAEHRARYEAMLAKVEAWDAPATHAGIKSFMISQLRESIDFDCGEIQDEIPRRESASAWFAKAIRAAKSDVAYLTKARAEEVERTEDRNRWLNDLRASLASTSSEAAP